MSIERLQRVTLAGLTGDKAGVLTQLQALGTLHLIPLRPVAREPEKEPSPHAVEAMAALRYLKDVRALRRQVRDPAGFDLHATVRTVLDNQQQLRDATDRRDSLRALVDELSLWGDFAVPPPEALGGQRLWFYRVPHRHLRDSGPRLDALGLPWQLVHRDDRQGFIVVVSPEAPPRDALPVPPAPLGSERLSAVQRALTAAEIHLEDVQAEHVALSRWVWLLSTHLARAQDEAQLRHAATQTHDDEDLFLVQGWVPVKAANAVRTLAEANGLAALIEEPGPDDRPPTLLDNPAGIAAGQDLVAFYQMPAYRAWDPSGVLFFSFAAFFAMILSDAGYAAVLGLLLVVYWGRLGQSEVGLRMRKLAIVMVTAALAWGVAVGGYFGISPPPETLLGRLHVLEVDDLATMMRLSIGVGVLHIVLANAQMVMVAGLRAQGRVALAWILVILGGFTLWLASTGDSAAWVADAARWAMIAGLAAIFLLGSDRPIDGIAAVALRVLDGLKNLTRITQAFGDVLSYLRLFALGLASASLAITFNGLAQDAAAALPGIGLLFAILILLAGHALNLALCIVSGLVHGLRLNFIEFYNWALSGEGYAFKPFKKTELRE